MATRTLKQMATTRALKVGHFLVEFATPGIGHMLKNSGCEFVVLDTEHSGFSFETVRRVVEYAHAADLPIIVRVPSKEYHHIARAADMGAEGLMLPMVNSADEARHILDCMKYPPEGGRGAAFSFAHDGYLPGTPLQKTREANRRTTLVAQIETAEGVKNVDEIAAVPGVDVLWVGHFDLSNSLGIPGQFNHKKFTDATGAVVKAARKHGKAAGRLVPTVEESVKLYKDGFDFISYSGDVWAFMGAIESAVTAIRKGCGATSRARTRAKPKARAGKTVAGRRKSS